MRDGARRGPGRAPDRRVARSSPSSRIAPSTRTASTRDELAHAAARPVPLHVIINPRLRWSSPARGLRRGLPQRPGFRRTNAARRRVRVEALITAARPSPSRPQGWYARILQHEIDHLDGVLYVDRMDTRDLSATARAHALAASAVEQVDRRDRPRYRRPLQRGRSMNAHSSALRCRCWWRPGRLRAEGRPSRRQGRARTRASPPAAIRSPSTAAASSPARPRSRSASAAQAPNR